MVLLNNNTNLNTIIIIVYEYTNNDSDQDTPASEYISTVIDFIDFYGKN